MQIYTDELEKNFGNFYDKFRNFSIYRGKGQGDSDDLKERYVGTLKGAIAVYKLTDEMKDDNKPRFLTETPKAKYEHVIVRVYIIKVMTSNCQMFGLIQFVGCQLETTRFKWKGIVSVIFLIVIPLSLILIFV